jgi:metal-dependent amidase/aminoacylase/carboxypeptidase family protein
VHIDIGYPAVYNNADATVNAAKLAKEFIGNENVEETEIRMGAEDFGFYAQQIPACFFRLGVRNEKKSIVHQVHTPNFNIDEAALETGAGIMALLGAELMA